MIDFCLSFQVARDLALRLQDAAVHGETDSLKSPTEPSLRALVAFVPPQSSNASSDEAEVAHRGRVSHHVGGPCQFVLVLFCFGFLLDHCQRTIQSL